MSAPLTAATHLEIIATGPSYSAVIVAEIGAFSASMQHSLITAEPHVQVRAVRGYLGVQCDTVHSIRAFRPGDPGRRPLTYDEITAGDPVTVTTRANMPARVLSKFRSREPAPGAPVGTEYVNLEAVDTGARCVNHPHQLERRTEIPTQEAKPR
ncbi:hypothetical protein AB0L82_35965 [Nocardia sp. NPDC052001]|uniref:hypothetical protein n=1 Tax=Nocardia sp. NPDC052001 TaxID=3154853 RepID=UPI0034499CEF